MNLPSKFVERKLSALLGAAVTVGEVNLSIISRTVEARNIRVVGDSPDRPLLSIDKITAGISVSHALKGELHIRSMVLQRPVLNLNRRAWFSTASNSPTGEAAPPGEFAMRMERCSARVADGEVHYRDGAGSSEWDVAVGGIAGELEVGSDGSPGCLSISAELELATIGGLMPGISLPPLLQAVAAAGAGKIGGRLDYHPGRGVTIHEFNLRALNVSLAPSPQNSAG